MSSGRGVIYIVWGNFEQRLLDRSMASLKAHHPELPLKVIRLADDASLLDKAAMMELTPFAETLFLDADTVVLDNLEFGFEKAARHGLACSICECPWARRYGGIDGDIVEYNTGVLFFTEQARPVFDAWRTGVAEIDSSIVFTDGGSLHRMPHNDQAGFSVAIDDAGTLPFVLPYNWNFRPKWHKSWFGPLKIWHDYEPVPERLLVHNVKQAASDSVVTLSVLCDER